LSAFLQFGFDVDEKRRVNDRWFEPKTSSACDVEEARQIDQGKKQIA